MSIKIVDNFVWKIITPVQAAALVSADIMNVYSLTEDKAEFLLESVADLDNIHREGFYEFAIEVGHLPTAGTDDSVAKFLDEIYRKRHEKEEAEKSAKKALDMMKEKAEKKIEEVRDTFIDISEKCIKAVSKRAVPPSGDTALGPVAGPKDSDSIHLIGYFGYPDEGTGSYGQVRVRIKYGIPEVGRTRIYIQISDSVSSHNTWFDTDEISNESKIYKTFARLMLMVYLPYKEGDSITLEEALEELKDSWRA